MARRASLACAMCSAGAILQALAYASGVTGVAGPALAILGATAWGAAQLADVLIFLRLRNQLGALSAGALAVKLAVAALLAWTS